MIESFIFKSGTWLEIETNKLINKIEEIDESKNGVMFLWNDENQSIRNELDVVAIKDSVPIFISCKDSDKYNEIALNELNVLFKKYERKFLADITQSSNVFLPLGGTLKSNELYYKDFIYKMNLLYSFWSKNIPIKIKYIQPSKGTYNPLEKISQKVENWANLSTPVKKKNTLMDRIKKEMEEYDSLIKLHPSAADLFNQSFDDLKERRLWRI